MRKHHLIPQESAASVPSSGPSLDPEPRLPSRSEAATIEVCLATLRRLRPDLEPYLVGRTRVLGWIAGQPWARGLPLEGPGWRGLASEGGVMIAGEDGSEP